MNPYAMLNLGAEYNAIMAEIEDADGELTPELEARHDEIVARLSGSAVNVVAALRMIDRGEDDLDDWIAKLTRRRDSLRKEAERWKSAAMRAMSEAGINRLEGELNGVPVKIGVMQSESVVVDNESVLPTEYMTEKIVRTPDKKAIKAALERGEPLPAHVERKPYLRVW